LRGHTAQIPAIPTIRIVIIVASEMRERSRRLRVLTFETASRLYDWANVGLITALVAGAISTVLVVWMGNIKEGFFRESIAAAEGVAAKANKETAKINERAAQLQAALVLEDKKQQVRGFRPEDRAAFIKTIKGKVDKAYIILLSSGTETLLFKLSIASALAEAGVNVLSLPGYRVPFSGLQVYFSESSLVNSPGLLLMAAFAVANTDTRTFGPDISVMTNLPTDAPVIIIGDKLPDLGDSLPLPPIPGK
jgi:hypothetical protein